MPADALPWRAQPGRVCKQLRTNVRGGGSQRRLEQLPDDPECKLSFELTAARGQHLEPCRRGQRARLGQKPRLPDPSGALDDNKPAITGARRTQHRLQRGHLRLTLEHESGGGCLCQLVCQHRDPPRFPQSGPERGRQALRRALATDKQLQPLLADAAIFESP
jgi:hypothetical protein